MQVQLYVIKTIALVKSLHRRLQCSIPDKNTKSRSKIVKKKKKKKTPKKDSSPKYENYVIYSLTEDILKNVGNQTADGSH